MEKVRKFPKFPEKTPQRGLYAFGTFRLDPNRRLLLREGEPLCLSSKDFDLLLVLVEQPGEVLVKEELMQRVWPDTIVEEGNLNRHISTLRRVLGESPEKHEYIVTVPGRGYRFVAAVREVWDDPQERALPLVDRVGATGLSVGELAAGKRDAGPAAISVSFPSLRSRRLRLGITLVLIATATSFVLVAARLIVLRSKPILSSTDSILISDFENRTGDPVFDDTLKEAVSVQLAQSPFLNVLSDARVHSTLKLMMQHPEARLTPDVAREVCQRSEAKVYISGTLARLGSQFVVGIRAVDCRTGDTLAQHQVSAKGKEEVLKAVDEASAKIRKSLGESLRTLQQYDTPLVEATTTSLEALQAFSQGDLARDRKGEAAAIPFFKHAIELDPQFALAYNALGLSYSNLDEPGLASENIARAYGLRDRASQLEKFHIAANYSQIVTGDLEQANQIAELWAQTYPRDPYPHNLIGVNFEFLGQYDKAAPEMVEAIRLYPDGVVLRSDLMDDYIALNQLAQAKAIFQSAMDRKLDHAYLHADRYAIAFLESDREEMDRQVAWSAGRSGAEDLLLSIESDSSAFQGDLGKAREYSERAVNSALRAGLKETAALWQLNAALRDAEFGDFELALREIKEGWALASSRDVRVLAALSLARAGDSRQAGQMEEDLARSFPVNTAIKNYWLPVIRAAIELDRKNPDKALELLKVAAPYEFAYPNPQVGVGRFVYPAYLRGEAYLRLGQGDRAVAEYEKFLAHPSIVVNCPLGTLARLQMSRAYLQQGDLQKARPGYSDFLAMWKKSDLATPILEKARAESAAVH